MIASGNVVAAAILARNPPKRPEIKFLIKNSPCYVGLNKDEPQLLEKVNAHPRRRQGRRQPERDRAEMARHRPAGRHLSAAAPRMNYSLRFQLDRPVSADPAQGHRRHGPADRGRCGARRGAGHRLRLGPDAGAGLAEADRRDLCRADPQHAVPDPAVLHLLRPALARRAAVRDDRGEPGDGDQSRRLQLRDHPRRHPGDAARPVGGGCQPRHDAGSRCSATWSWCRRCSGSGRRCRRRS